jgi:Zn-dependent M28 family amino/carboxypeptidase
MLGLQDQGGVRRASEKGAVVVFEVSMLPGNMRYQAYPSGAKVPSFTVGNDDGTAVRQMIEAAKDSAAPKIKVSLDVEKVPNKQTALIWGTLPGTTDETIYIAAHKDGWFDGASDNGGGVASILGLAEYYAKIPRVKRKRTLVFVGLDGHHNGADGGVGRRWMVANKATLFPKTALFINVEHPATIVTQSRPRYYPGDELAWANTYMPLEWYAGGKTRPELQKITWDAFKKFGVPAEFDPSPVPPAGDAGAFFRFLPAVSASEYHSYFHTDWETPEMVPWTGLEAATRAFASIIDKVNTLPLSTFQRPEEPAPQRAVAD